jgi:hypothetical protein
MVGALAYDDAALAVRRQTIRKIQLPDACTLAAKRARKHVLAAATVPAPPALPAAAAAHTIRPSRLFSPDCTTTATTNGSCCSNSGRRLKPAAPVALERWVYGTKGLAKREVENLQRLLREPAQGRWFQYLAGISAAAAAARRLRCGGRSERRDG